MDNVNPIHPGEHLAEILDEPGIGNLAAPSCGPGPPARHAMRPYTATGVRLNTREYLAAVLTSP